MVYGAHWYFGGMICKLLLSLKKQIHIFFCNPTTAAAAAASQFSQPPQKTEKKA